MTEAWLLSNKKHVHAYDVGQKRNVSLVNARMLSINPPTNVTQLARTLGSIVYNGVGLHPACSSTYLTPLFYLLAPSNTWHHTDDLLDIIQANYNALALQHCSCDGNHIMAGFHNIAVTGDNIIMRMDDIQHFAK